MYQHYTKALTAAEETLFTLYQHSRRGRRCALCISVADCLAIELTHVVSSPRLQTQPIEGSQAVAAKGGSKHWTQIYETEKA